MGGTPRGSAAPANEPARRRHTYLLVVCAVGAVLVVLALAVFEPWTLVTDHEVDEAPPGAVAVLPSPSVSLGGKPAASPSIAPTQEPVAPTLLVSGTFISHEHGTSGRAAVLELADGGRVLRIEDLDTSNGPDLHVWLAAAPVVAGREGWFVFDDLEHVDLGALKGNRGNQNYLVPDGVDLDRLSSVSIWCERFHVSFGAAALSPE